MAMTSEGLPAPFSDSPFYHHCSLGACFTIITLDCRTVNGFSVQEQSPEVLVAEVLPGRELT